MWQQTAAAFRLSTLLLAPELLLLAPIQVGLMVLLEIDCMQLRSKNYFDTIFLLALFAAVPFCVLLDTCPQTPIENVKLKESDTIEY